MHHADAHKHMHLHPTVARLMIEIGREYGQAHPCARRTARDLGLIGEKITAGDRALFTPGAACCAPKPNKPGLPPPIMFSASNGPAT